jgi:hypothetical protein
MPGVTFNEVNRTPTGAGTTYRFRTQAAGITIRGSGRFVEFQPNRLIRDETTLGIEGSLSWHFQPHPSGTRLPLEHHPGRIWGVPLLGRLPADSYQRSDEDVLRHIQAACEQGASPTSPPRSTN